MSFFLRIEETSFVHEIQKKMIVEKLKVEEFVCQNKINEENKRLKTVKNILKLLDEIDFTAEEIPSKDPERLLRLLVFLKGESLNKDESQLVNKLMNS
jgi:UTP:GlnB (protein PII) uridylyltransferase